MNHITKRQLIRYLTILISIFLILFEIMSLYFIDYFAGDCMSSISRYVVISFYSTLIFAGLLLIFDKAISIIFYRISGLGLIMISIINLIIDLNCWLGRLIFIHLITGILIGIITRDKTKMGLATK